MTIVHLAQVREEKTKRQKEDWKKWLRRQLRFLWSKTFIASRHYSCDYCICPIEPGDEYERQVYVDRYRFWVKRKHYPECFAPTEEDDRRMREELAREDQAERKKEFRKSA